ncbi:hypothetical protein [Paenibacillus periandrae]|uniref:hypothetical protein n=1 Tax=Paenibacillus periandrae TaxID=1761741 RepID=UPI001F093655|nr:hypothetical protein [Paenibacillus periandrae]
MKPKLEIITARVAIFPTHRPIGPITRIKQAVMWLMANQPLYFPFDEGVNNDKQWNPRANDLNDIDA